MDQSKFRLSCFDFSFVTLCFVWPLYFFPHKSTLVVQFSLGIAFACLITLVAQDHRLSFLRRAIPLLESLYGPAKGLLFSLVSLGLFSFFQQSWLFSRYINLIALISIGLYLLVSRKLLFKRFIVEEIHAGEPRAQPAWSTNCSAYVGQVSSHELQPVVLCGIKIPGEEVGIRLLSFENDHFTLLFSRFRFIKGRPAIELPPTQDFVVLPPTMRAVKRLMDIFLGLFFLLVGLPAILVAAALSIVIHRENPFFLQKRFGYKGRIFKILKLKSFFGTPARVTAWGRILRRLNVDELPQFWNIFVGDMSLVGPRAETYERSTEMTPHQLIRNLIAPGLTGFWQISPYRGKPIRDRLEYDVYYLLTCSPLVDLIVLGLTPFFAFSNNTEK